MATPCKQCGHVRLDNEPGPATRCPYCGVSYAETQKPGWVRAKPVLTTRSESSGIGSSILWTGLTVLALLIAEHFYDPVKESEAWPTVSGRVLYTRINYDPNDDPKLMRDFHWKLEINYHYEVGGVGHDGYLFGFDDNYRRFKSRYDAVLESDKYPKGSTVLVHYDPSTPAMSVLIPGTAASTRNVQDEVQRHREQR